MKNIFIVFLMISALGVYAQKGIVNNGARIVVENGAYIKVQGDNTTGYTNKSYGSKHGRIDLDGEIVVNGFFNNNATANSVFINRDGTGKVTFEGTSAQSIGGSLPIAFEGLELSGEDVTLSTDISLSGILDFNSGLLDLNGSLLSFESGATVSGSPGPSSMIIPGTTGIVRKYYTSPASFTYPIGENSGSAEYLPVISNITSATFGSGAYLDLQMFDSKHPENTNTTDFISRYWDFSEYNISSFAASLSYTYANGDINGTEGNIYTLGFDGTFWNVYDAASASTNKLTADVTQFDQITGGGTEAVTPQISWFSDGIIEENMEDGSEIRVEILNDQLVGTLTQAQWNVSGLPAGVSVGSVTRAAADTAVITLSGNRDDDYDSHITISLTVNASQFVHTSTGALTPDTDITIYADNDGEYIEMSDDNSLVEGSENGEIIQVTLTGGTFADPLTTGNWVGINMPTGVALGTINRVSSSLVEITLDGNATVDYDMDITNFQLTIPASDINEYGSNYVLTSGVTFKAIDESLVISMTDGGSGIDEGAEDGHLIVVSIDERVFADPVTQASWELFNIPDGVNIGSVFRTNDTAVYITLSGNRTTDYDANITNTELTIASSQITGVSNPVTISSGVTFNADNDTESLSIAADGDGIIEGSEDGEVITVTLTGGTFPNPLTKVNWSLSNLPQGVSVGDVSRTSMTTAEIILTGNREVDFDSDITNISLSVTEDEIDDYTSGSLTSDNTITVLADVDIEEIALSGGPFVEGSEDGGIITATLTGGTFAAVTISDVSLTNLPVGVSLDNLNQISNTELELVLSGNATDDYDADINDATLTVDAAVIDETSVDVAGTGIVFQAIVEPVILILSDNDDLYEEEEDANQLTIKVREDMFVPSIDPGAFTFAGLPGGVSAGSVVRTNDTTVTVTLSGNRTTDYDSDILDAGVEIAVSELQESVSPLSAYTGWRFIATDDGEFVSFSTTATITEGAEDGTEINIAVSGGTLAESLDEAEWSFTGLPGGVTVGSISRTDELNAIITLAGNASADYDADIIVDELIVSGTQIDDFDDASITAVGSVTFNATIETQDLVLLPVVALDESNLDGAQLGLKLIGATFVSPLNVSDFMLNNMPAGLTIDGLTEISADSAVLDLAFDGTDFDVNYPNFNVTLVAAGSSLGLSVNSNVTNINAIVEPGSMEIAHAGLTETNLDGAIVDVTLINDQFVDDILDIGNFTLNNAPLGIDLAAVSYVSATTATIELMFDGTDFDADFANFTVSMAAAENVTGNLYESNALTITAIDDDEQIAFVDPVTIIEGNEGGQVLEVEITGGTFVESLNISDWSMSYLPDGVNIGDVIYIDQNNVEVHLNGNAAVDYDVNETASLSVSATQFNDGAGSIQTTNDIVFDAYEEMLYTLVDTIQEQAINSTAVLFTLQDDWLTDLTPDDVNFVLQDAPVGLDIVSINVIDSANFELSLEFTGDELEFDIAFSVMVSDNILNGLESLISNYIVIESQVGIHGLSDGIDIYFSGNSLIVKQMGAVKKGNITLFETSGKVAAEFSVEAKTVNIFKPLLKENVYLIKFSDNVGNQYRTKGFLNN